MSTFLSDRPLDIVVYGATGFVGRLVAAHLAAHAPRHVRIGLAGRSLKRLHGVRDGLGPSAESWPLLVADSEDERALDELARSTRVVATTVGPYAAHGLPFVLACARAGTSTCDLTGEVLFVRRCIDQAHELALASGARIVNACGFDSVPSDLGVLLTAERARAEGAGDLGATTFALLAARGGFSGGTIASMRGQLDEVRADPGLRALVRDPYALSPDRPAEPDRGPRSPLVGHAVDLGVWFGPFVMAPFNTRIVRRSNALQGWAYGRGFRYREVHSTGSSPLAPGLALALAAGVGLGASAVAFTPTRALVDRVLPGPGEGPSEQTRDGGSFATAVAARTRSGAVYRTDVAADGDPGYAATAVMLGESALALALDDGVPGAAGVLTPATALGSGFADRLRAAGFRITTRSA